MENQTHHVARSPVRPVPREDILRRVKEFGYEEVARHAGIKAYQTVANFCEGRNVHKSTRTLIMAALDKLEGERSHQDRQKDENGSESMHVVPFPMFQDLRREVERLSGQMALLMKTQLAAHQWVGSHQAANILNCSLITLHRRKQAGELEFRKNGSRVEYNIEGLMQYLQARHFKPEVIQERVLSTLAV